MRGNMSSNNSDSSEKKLDKKDQEIIKLLQTDGRLSNTIIAKKLGISEATVRNRLNRLINEEYIQIVAVSNPLKLGFKITGGVRIIVNVNKTDNIIKKLKEFKPLWYIVQSTGGSDINAGFMLKSIDELHDLLNNKINKINGVIRTETYLILKFVKRRYDWGTGYE